MFASLRRHQKWFWLLVIIVVIPSFVIFFSDTSFRRSRESRSDVGSINGRAISREEFIDAKQEIRLEYILSRGTLPERDEQTEAAVNRETYARIFFIEKQKELGINPSKDAVGKAGA